MPQVIDLADSLLPSMDEIQAISPGAASEIGSIQQGNTPGFAAQHPMARQFAAEQAAQGVHFPIPHVQPNPANVEAANKQLGMAQRANEPNAAFQQRIASDPNLTAVDVEQAGAGMREPSAPKEISPQLQAVRQRIASRGKVQSLVNGAKPGPLTPERVGYQNAQNAANSQKAAQSASQSANETFLDAEMQAGNLDPAIGEKIRGLAGEMKPSEFRQALKDLKPAKEARMRVPVVHELDQLMPGPPNYIYDKDSNVVKNPDAENQDQRDARREKALSKWNQLYNPKAAKAAPQKSWSDDEIRAERDRLLKANPNMSNADLRNELARLGIVR